MWLKVRKIVDRLHMRNHKDPLCNIKYGSNDLKEKYPHLNTPVAEQTFIWAGRFKKIMCAMPKQRFLFFYHRMVICRNRYISVCYQENRVPEFPAVHGKSKKCSKPSKDFFFVFYLFISSWKLLTDTYTYLLTYRYIHT